ncbi:MAG: 5-methyltetrahydropteroyltriglutamate--homocysteine S-methyltransferase [Acidothermus sp.]|nr:5-methyltetrahydropteroyltriglutamate--homocysteine S-methyltransferase [Acidothermus sp.]
MYGYPRQGPHRELKKATEAFWARRIDAETLLRQARELRLRRFAEIRDAGIDEIPCNDFSFYDHVLDTACMLGAFPRRHMPPSDDDSPAARLDHYFALARGTYEAAPLEMTKWFDTNYHYLVPELRPDMTFRLDARKVLTEFREGRELGLLTRPVVLGPVSFLLLSKPEAGVPRDFDRLSLLESLLCPYLELLRKLFDVGAEWIQFDEPCLVTDQPPPVLDAVRRSYATLCAEEFRPRILVATYFDKLGEALPVLAESPIEGIAMDFTGRASANLDDLAAIGGVPTKRLVAGVIDGRNVWAADLAGALATLGTLLGLAETVDVAPSCSLLHVPLDVDLERSLDPHIAGWLAFARQKLDELVILARGLNEGWESIAGELQVNASRRTSRSSSPMVHVDAVRARLAEAERLPRRRPSAYPERRAQQRARLALPPLPTTTIGSFPQTAQLRTARARLRSGELDQAGYDELIRREITDVIGEQERLGLDVLVHGEPERNDMVQYFAEQLDGFLVTTEGWVQSYGTRYVRPPIIVGDVSRPKPMTVTWAAYAQSLTKKPVKGMLTGPVTMLAWSFVRDDQPRAETARQVALALRDEVADLEAIGISVIQIDEPALRESLPLRRADRADYLAWAVDAFHLVTGGVRDDTQIHTHMCYAEFGDILDAIIAMDADVISLEAARSDMAIVTDLARAGYPNEVGPGVWDVHSPRVPTVAEVVERIRLALKDFPPERLWVNPDCGLKTRDYPEVRAALANLVAAARLVRAELDDAAS